MVLTVFPTTAVSQPPIEWDNEASRQLLRILDFVKTGRTISERAMRYQFPRREMTADEYRTLFREFIDEEERLTIKKTRIRPHNQTWYSQHNLPPDNNCDRTKKMEFPNSTKSSYIRSIEAMSPSIGPFGVVTQRAYAKIVLRNDPSPIYLEMDEFSELCPDIFCFCTPQRDTDVIY